MAIVGLIFSIAVKEDLKRMKFEAKKQTEAHSYSQLSCEATEHELRGTDTNSEQYRNLMTNSTDPDATSRLVTRETRDTRNES